MQKVYIENSRGRVEFYKSRPFILQSISGLSNPNTRNITTQAPGQDGVSRHGSNFEARTLLLEVGVIGEDKQDMYRLRNKLYSVLNGRLNSKLVYENSYKSYSIDCSIENITEGEKLRNIQQIILQLYCPDPFWSDIDEIKEEVAMWLGNFHFPLIIPKGEGIIMGSRVSNLIVNVLNKGDVPCGMTIEFVCTKTVKNISLFNVYTREYIKVKGSFKAGDLIRITTQFGNKRVELIRNGVSSNIFHYLDIDSVFLQLDLGDNVFRYDADSGIDNLEVSIYYKPKYLGV
ncbi:putative phage tail protein [Gottschalkia purinilytica]|uniref:Putative phage tail protein n=1 Tax=Gottschalkia purinilytica TaxID=1503 RepID=A0A0L0W6U3_GOTPU|nr:distal tail protein Dit [Gottschalkia purinilytica]KNF06960.1 putative phage tail protein [Gottschalkia purinilytica]